MSAIVLQHMPMQQCTLEQLWTLCVEIYEDKFLAYFWWCYDRLKKKTDDNVPMPTFFHFLALLAFKIFAAEQVDVSIMEVGLGGKYNATNMVQAPVVCGITSLGYDHIEIFGWLDSFLNLHSWFIEKALSRPPLI